jgi:DNA repair protein RadA/Sms|tara:strand:+ start:452209 stop:453561 length:1353 start_codon:yes stop_codon:yes gene_type:complete
LAKTKSIFVCENCGSSSPKWLGRCPQCEAWNSIIEVLETPKNKQQERQVFDVPKKGLVPLHKIDNVEDERLPLFDEGLNRVLGGGLVKGSVVLLGGDPGIGKSTLLLQNALKSEANCVYVSGEESMAQIKMRSGRVKGNEEQILLLSETSLEEVQIQLKRTQPQWVIIDSIQTLNSGYIESVPGSISQIRACTAALIEYAKNTNVPIILVGHITKDGQLAGPKILEHMVDVVLQFEGDRNNYFRMLRCRKNRFGSVHDIALYDMGKEGLKHIDSPGDYLLNSFSDDLSGVAHGLVLEGVQPLVLEVQALVSSAVYGTPQRSATGFDVKRLNMLLAVLEKRCQFKLGAKDVFLNLAGGFRTADTALDLAVVSCILSSASDMALPPKVLFIGEIALSGEIRPVGKIDLRLKEAEKLGYEKVVLSQYQTLEGEYALKIAQYKRVDDMFFSEIQ